MRVTDIWKIPEHNHKHLEFVNVAINSDNRLFIDPVLLETSTHPWANSTYYVLKSFTDTLISAYCADDEERIDYLLQHAHERNEVRLGYGRGNNGKGNTQKGLKTLLEPLRVFVKTIPTLRKPQDLPLVLPGFAEDGLSDLITNVILFELNEFTLQQMDRHGISPNDTTTFYHWNSKSLTWDKKQTPCFSYLGQVLFLVPKQIVRHEYFFDTGKYFSKIILDKEREKPEWVNPNEKFVPKKIMAEIIKGRSRNKHWIYEFAMQVTTKYPELLTDYHIATARDYKKKSLSDAKIDEVIFGKNPKKLSVEQAKSKMVKQKNKLI